MPGTWPSMWTLADAHQRLPVTPCAVSLPSSWCFLRLSVFSLGTSAGALTCAETAQKKLDSLIIKYLVRCNLCTNVGWGVYLYSLYDPGHFIDRTAAREIAASFFFFSPTHSYIYTHKYSHLTLYMVKSVNQCFRYKQIEMFQQWLQEIPIFL